MVEKVCFDERNSNVNDVFFYKARKSECRWINRRYDLRTLQRKNQALLENKYQQEHTCELYIGQNSTKGRKSKGIYENWFKIK